MNETIQLILREVRARKYSEVKRLLDELDMELENLQEFFDEIKKVCRDSGRTSVISISKIEELITKYGEKK